MESNIKTVTQERRNGFHPSRHMETEDSWVMFYQTCSSKVRFCYIGFVFPSRWLGIDVHRQYETRILKRSTVLGNFKSAEQLLTRTEVVMFEHVALKAAAGREVFGAVGHRAASPQGAGVLLMLFGVDVEAATC